MSGSELPRRTGLVKWKFDKKMISSWVCLQPHLPREGRTDCLQNVLAFLEILNKNVAEKLASFIDARGIGTYIEEMFNLIDEKTRRGEILREHFYKSEGYVNLDDDESLNKFLDYVRKMIGPNNAILVEFRSTSPSISGHAMVFAVTDDNKLLLLDPQHLEIFDSNESIHEFLNRLHFDIYGILYIKKVVRGLETTAVPIRKNKAETQTRKKRKLNTPSPPRSSMTTSTSRRSSPRLLLARTSPPRPPSPRISPSRPLFSQSTTKVKRKKERRLQPKSYKKKKTTAKTHVINATEGINII